MDGSTTEIQSAALVTDDLAPYRGSWVAVSDGKVVDSALDPTVLRDRPGARSDDYLLLVPSDSDASGIFVL